MAGPASPHFHEPHAASRRTLAFQVKCHLLTRRWLPFTPAAAPRAQLEQARHEEHRRLWEQERRQRQQRQQQQQQQWEVSCGRAAGLRLACAWREPVCAAAPACGLPRFLPRFLSTAPIYPHAPALWPQLAIAHRSTP